MKSGVIFDQVRLSPDYINRTGVQDLPFELLLNIISLASKTESANLARAEQLSTICARWQKLVEESPEIWTLITGWDRPETVNKAITKSRNRSLDIMYHFKHHHGIHDMREFFQATCPHAQRWRRATIVLTWSNRDLLQGFSIGAAPRLESLTLKARDYSGGVLTLFEGVALPHLRALDVCRVSLSWGGEQFSNLQRLFIFANGENSPSLQDILSVLRITSRLEGFTYGGLLSPVTDDENGTRSRDFILLPSMKYLWLYGSLGVLEILNHIRAPACLKISLQVTLGPRGLVPHYSGMSQFLPLIISLGNQGERVQIGVSAESADFNISGINFRFSHATQSIQIANWMMQNLTDESLEIELSISDRKFTAEQFDSLIPPTMHRRVSKLGIRRYLDQADSILQYLSKPRSGSEGQNRWPLPHLREIAILTFSRDLSGILSMLRARADAVDSLETGGLQKITTLQLNYKEIDLKSDANLISEIDEFMRENEGTLVTTHVSK